MEPIIKWAGGKRQLLPEIKKRIPPDIKKYVEPFFGGGAVFFDIDFERAVISDTNEQLINMYKMVREMPFQLIEQLEHIQKEYNMLSHDEQSSFYYDKRTEFNTMRNANSIEGAALFIFLNKTCYNGLYRENASGEYNTPFGKRKQISLYDEVKLLECSEKLKRTKIICGDFSEACKNLRVGTFVYFDSPYYDTFDTYQAGGFTEAEHIRLAELFNALSERNIKCMLSNSDTEFIRKLYSEYVIETVEVKRMINCDGKKRSGTEIIVKNFK
ncbi:MAG: DNA adenine methylase [Lachnospiraceae bacterium]|nr:DNA adenine methylase [Lachnospiraceae bacterium]